MPKLKNKKQFIQSGFTLIELMVVVSIITFISSVLLVSVVKARAKGRDAKRLDDLVVIQKALEFYYDDHGGYPSTACTGFSFPAWNSPDNSSSATGICDVPLGPITYSNIDQALAKYIKPISDPKPQNTVPIAGHWYISNGKEFIYQIIGYPENMVNYPKQYVDTSLCSLPLATDGTCGTSGTDPYLTNNGYPWINSATVSSFAQGSLFKDSSIHGFFTFFSGG